MEQETLNLFRGLIGPIHSFIKKLFSPWVRRLRAVPPLETRFLNGPIRKTNSLWTSWLSYNRTPLYHPVWPRRTLISPWMNIGAKFTPRWLWLWFNINEQNWCVRSVQPHLYPDPNPDPCHVQISGLHDFHMSLIAQNTTDDDEEDGRMTMVGLLIEVRTPLAVSGLPE